jgi:hypothetical protein
MNEFKLIIKKTAKIIEWNKFTMKTSKTPKKERNNKKKKF